MSGPRRWRVSFPPSRGSWFFHTEAGAKAWAQAHVLPSERVEIRVVTR